MVSDAYVGRNQRRIDRVQTHLLAFRLKNILQSFHRTKPKPSGLTLLRPGTNHLATMTESIRALPVAWRKGDPTRIATTGKGRRDSTKRRISACSKEFKKALENRRHAYFVARLILRTVISEYTTFRCAHRATQNGSLAKEDVTWSSI